ncbi:phosphotransferase [Paenibacillus donghaensis]|uniref:phosphotransferase n=1 Tax=Paenibacillus donghaensis TaxID=414771 RepID=UPI001FE67164|nr:phosphotransferase [Paenibacillus donghaensis]
MIKAPRVVSGGLLHQMYRVETTTGTYAIKALNPQIMQRPDAMCNYIQSEQIAKAAAQQIPALPAKEWHGRFMHEIGGQYYLVFDYWADGQSLKAPHIKLSHCHRMGAILADIHQMDFSGLECSTPEPTKAELSDWTAYVQKGWEQQAVWSTLMEEASGQLYEWNAKASRAAQLLATGMVLSHRDLDPKNVLWNDDQPLVIDWEAAGYIHPKQELIETAVYWSEDESGDLNEQKFKAFMAGYVENGGNVQPDWEPALALGFMGKLDWLEYSLKRSLWLECSSEEEQQLGTEQVAATLHSLRRYNDNTSVLAQWLMAVG